MLDDFEDKFPSVRVSREQTFIDQGHIITAGGLSAGIDMSLHIVSRYFGVDVAKQTADFIEYKSERWMQ